MGNLDTQHRLSKSDVDKLTRARVVLDAIYDSLMAVNLSVKPILVMQLREVHAIVFGLEQVGARPLLRGMLRRGVLKPEDLPEWARIPEPPAAAPAAETTEEQG